jgi:carbonic anhydrase
MCNEKWNYKNHGEDWQCECSEGSQQSPIDLPEINEAKETLHKTLFSFYKMNKDDKGNNLEMTFEDNMLKIKGNLGSIVTWELIKYELYEVQFHTGSEHTIKGEQFDMEVQFYYRSITQGCIGKSAAVGVLFKIEPGSTNLFFDKTLNILDLPDQFEKRKIFDNKKYVDLRDLFRIDEDDMYEGFSYFQYEGSLTSPNCQGIIILFYYVLKIMFF